MTTKVSSTTSISSSLSGDTKTELSDDIGNLVGDCSDINSDDSGNWMQKIDVKDFRHLTDDNRFYSQMTGSLSTATFVDDHRHYSSTSAHSQSDSSAGIPAQRFLSSGMLPGPPPAQSGSVGRLTARRMSQEDSLVASFPSPDSNQPPKKKDRTSWGSVDSPRDYALESKSKIECNVNSISPAVGVCTSTTKTYPKPMYSYSCLIALALKNSPMGRLTVADIYNFMCTNFPYFRTAPAGWKNSVRHNLSLNKCFDKIEIEAPGGHGRKSCLWKLHEAKKTKMDQEIRKWREKDPTGVKESLSNPDDLELIEQGLKGMPGDPNAGILNTNFLPEIIKNQHQANLESQLLLVRSQSYLTHAQSLGVSGQTAWSPAHIGNLHPAPPATPPRAPSGHTDFSSCSPHVISSPASFSTPVQQRGPISVQQPTQQSSPFTQTPPYSPNVHSPQMKMVCNDWSHTQALLNQQGRDLGAATGSQSNFYQSGSNMAPPGHYSPFNIGRITAAAAQMQSQCESPTQLLVPATTGHYSPCKSLGFGFSGFETASNALNNNSLLQTALAQSPCNMGQTVVTLQNL